MSGSKKKSVMTKEEYMKKYKPPQKIVGGVRLTPTGLSFYTRQWPMSPEAPVPFTYRSKHFSSLYHFLVHTKLGFLGLYLAQERLARDSRYYVIKDMDKRYRIPPTDWVDYLQLLWVMVNEGVAAMWECSPRFRKALWDTGERFIAYGSTSDSFLGSGLAPDNIHSLDFYYMRGNNELGEALMQLRREKVMEGYVPEDGIQAPYPEIPPHLLITKLQDRRAPPPPQPPSETPPKSSDQRRKTRDPWQRSGPSAQLLDQ